MLYLVATPIGHLGDITFRAVEVLRSVDYILCEDTRHSHHLLAHYGIQKPLKSYHKFNETSREEDLIADLKNGLNIALISDAGTPGICDPGLQLVQRCREEGIAVTALPGACAAILALAPSGLNSERFQFVGFLPKKTSELRNYLQEILQYPGTTICYESPHRIEETLEALDSLAAGRPLAIARELTKTFEEYLRGTASELLAHFKAHPPRGEIVLLIAGETETQDFSSLSPQEHVQALQEQYGLSKQEAIKLAATLRNVPKKTIYKATLTQLDSEPSLDA